MMTQNGHEVPESILVKIQKLLALSESANEHEAAAAASKAQELLFKHELSISDLEGVEANAKPVREEQLVVNEGHRGVNWKLKVLDAVVKTSMCRYLVSWYTLRPNRTVTKAYIIGRPADIEMAKYTFNFLRTELERLATAYVASYTGPWHGITVRNSWLMGAATGVSVKLNAEFDARRESSKKSTALIVNKETAIKEFMEREYPNLKGSYSSTTGDIARSAYTDGYQTGRQLGTARALSDSGSNKRLE